MPGFQFELSQLITIPNNGRPGQISGRMEFVNDETIYKVKWLDKDELVYSEMFPESIIVAAQLPAAAETPKLPDVNFGAAASRKPSRKHSRKSKRRAMR